MLGCTPPPRGGKATIVSCSSMAVLSGGATGCSWQPVGARVVGTGLKTVGVEADPHGNTVDEYLRAGERLWAIG
jgi:hypothetical protein